jgi:hypothetical protein
MILANQRYLNDRWTLSLDDLGFKRVGEQAVNMAAYSDPPFAIGVFGKWGSGKTSLLRYAMARLGGKPVMALNPTSNEPHQETPIDEWDAIPKPDIPHIEHIRCVWFNPWQYQNEPNLLLPLLHEIRSQMSFWIKAGSTISKLAKVSVESGIELLGHLSEGAAKLGLGTPTGLGKMVDRIRQIGERYERENFESLTDSQRFSLLFENAVNRLLGGDPDDFNELAKKRRLVIFIDDLDRCDDARALYLLETIKLYLSTPYCVFVFGMDGGAVEKALYRAWQEKKSLIEVREYLEKLFQGIVHVPTSQDYSLFIKNQLAERGIKEASQNNDLIEILNQILEPNPRKVKNFLTAMQAFYFSLENDVQNNSAFKFSHLALLTYLKLYFPDVYRTVEYDVENFSILLTVFDDWKKSLQTHRQIAAFYCYAFRHVLEIAGLQAESTTTAFVEGMEQPTRKDESKSPDKSYIEAMEQGYKFIKDSIDRHHGDMQFIKFFITSFKPIISDKPYLTDLIRPAKAKEQSKQVTQP